LSLSNLCQLQGILHGHYIYVIRPTYAAIIR
jgi:hypothetical protein